MQPKYLKRARLKNIELEAVLRSCKIIAVSENGATLTCPYKFHRGKLKEHNSAMVEIFGENIEVFESKQDYIENKMQDPLIKFAVNELGAVIA